MRCKFCGKQLDEGSVVCPRCGKSGESVCWICGTVNRSTGFRMPPAGCTCGTRSTPPKPDTGTGGARNWNGNCWHF